MKINRKCIVEGCNSKIRCKGYCRKHYQQLRKYGEICERTQYDPNEIITYDNYAEIVLYNKKQKENGRAIIDIEDIDKCRIYKWCLQKGEDEWSDYAKTIANNKNLYLHKLVFSNEQYEDNLEIDHINRNGLDNRKNNLRIGTKNKNKANVKQINNNSGFTGVCIHKTTNQWRAYVTVNYKSIHLGLFDNIEDAILARKNAEIKYFGEVVNNEFI